MPQHPKGTVFASPFPHFPVLDFMLLTKEMIVNSILWYLIPSRHWLRNIRYLIQRYKSKPTSKFGFRFFQCLLKLPFLLVRFMKVTDSQQLCSCEGTLETVKTRNTFRNIGCSIFLQIPLSLGGGQRETGPFELKLYLKESKQKPPLKHVEILLVSQSYRFYSKLVGKILVSSTWLIILWMT